MSRTHTYQTSVTWTGNRGTGTSGYGDYDRNHEVGADGRAPIEASSEPLFRGDPTLWNPELEMTAALSQCHMLWYLHLCAATSVIVTSYVDNARGTMLETAGGGGHFTEVVLSPHVVVSSWDMVEEAVELHVRAHNNCFIANSVNFPVHCKPVVAVAKITPVELDAGQ
jgi:organic hydroperoxide reductase OsmC/OhrA